MALMAATGCGQCSPSSPPVPPEPPPSFEAPAPLPPAHAWTFQEMRGVPLFASPRGCTPRAPALRAQVAQSTGFLAERGTPSTLVIADASDDASRLLGVSLVTFDAAGAIAAQRPLPWLAPEVPPRLGRTAEGGWLSTFGEHHGAGSVELGLAREDAAERVGEGDRFEAVDLMCEAGACALLTPRLGRVAMPGAEVWLGAATAPIATWKRVVIEAAGDEGQPLAIAAIEPSSPGSAVPRAALVALSFRKHVAFFRAEGAPGDASPIAADAGQAMADAGQAMMDAGPISTDAGQTTADASPPAPDASPPAPDAGQASAETPPPAPGNVAAPQGVRETWRVASPHGVLDALGLPAPTVMLHGTPVDDEGCVRTRGALAGDPQDDAAQEDEVGGGDRDAPTGSRASVRFAQGGQHVDVQAPAPPLRGALRRLRRGALATWIAPLGCRSTRKVVYAVRLDASGKPEGAVIPVADAERYAVAASGDAVDLWLQRGDAVIWARLTCGEVSQGR
ncbi:Hypothetical protein CAP_5292 [Chondromyces apiculatus DSM 436]|uniref:Uncharacterized protein n=1 Tax=Chondromyces apiculatus DSM 436 TaxID=1192034 RepID=A0A017T549_9BACT|nr:Hypothetical protein CAP_5292 [Chondromyces apiculatus DSM 436]